MTNNNFNGDKKFNPLPPLPPLPPAPGRQNNINNPVPPQTFTNVNPQQQPYEAAQNIQPPQNWAPQPSAPKKSKKTLFIILGIIVTVAVIGTAAFFFIGNTIGSMTNPNNNNNSSNGGTSTGANPEGKTTQYEENPAATSKTALDPATAVVSKPAYKGYTGGTTYVSFSPETAWENGKKIDNEDVTGGNWGAVYGFIGICSLFIGVVRDGDSPEVQWSQPGGEAKTTETLLSLWAYNTADVTTLETRDISFPSHTGAEGQIPGKVYKVPASVTGEPADTYTSLMFDYNTGYVTGISVKCLSSEDSLGLFNQIINPDNEHSIYVDVIK